MGGLFLWPSLISYSLDIQSGGHICLYHVSVKDHSCHNIVILVGNQFESDGGQSTLYNVEGSHCNREGHSLSLWLRIIQ